MAIGGAFLGGAAGGAAINIVIQAIDKFSKPMKKVENGLKKQQKGFGKLTDFLKAHKIAVMAAAGAIVAFGVSAVKSALKSEQAFQSFNLVVGETADLLLEDMRRASRGMISDFELVDNANKALALGIKQSDIPGLLEVATARAKIFGRTATEAFNDLTIGIGRQSRMILDNLGIILDLDKVYEDYAKIIGKTADEVRDLYAKEAIANAIIEESAGLVKAQNFLLETHAEQISRLTSEWKNFTDEVGKFLLQTYDMISGQALANETFKLQLDILTGVPGTYEEIASAIMDYDKAQRRLTDSLKSSNIEAERLIDSLLNLSDITFEGERHMKLQIAQQKEVIRQLELRELGGEDVEDQLEKERDVMKKLRLDSEEYAIAREIQQAKNAMGLEEMGELESVTFENFAQNEQNKFTLLEEERTKQQNLRDDIQRIQDAEEELLSVFTDAQLEKIGGWKAEEESIDDLIKKLDELPGKYLAGVEAQRKRLEELGVEPKEITKMTSAESEKLAKDLGIDIPKEFKEAEFWAKPEKTIIDFLDAIADAILAPFGVKPGYTITGEKLERYQQGGVVPSTGPAIVHRGETIIPAGRASGITVYINNLNGFNAQDIANNLNEELEARIKI